MNTRARLLCGTAVVGVRPNGDVSPCVRVPHELVSNPGNPGGFAIRLRGPLRYSPYGYGHVESTRKRWRAGPTLVNARGFCGRRSST
jgi:hypothetical protein